MTLTEVRLALLEELAEAKAAEGDQIFHNGRLDGLRKILSSMEERDKEHPGALVEFALHIAGTCVGHGEWYMTSGGGSLSYRHGYSEAYKRAGDLFYRLCYNVPLEAALESHGVGRVVAASELAMHTKSVDKKVKLLWAVTNERGGQYGYALLNDDSFLHGCLDLNDDNWISLS